MDPRSPSKPVKIIAGHNKPITRMVKGYDDSNPTLITAGSDGRVVEWSVADAATRVMQVFKVRGCTEKEWDWQKKMPVTKNSQFYSKQLKIQAILPTDALASLTKFHNGRAKNVDSLWGL